MIWTCYGDPRYVGYTAKSGPVELRVREHGQGGWVWTAEYEYLYGDSVRVVRSQQPTATKETAKQQAKDAMLQMLAEEQTKINKIVQELKELGR